MDTKKERDRSCKNVRIIGGEVRPGDTVMIGVI